MRSGRIVSLISRLPSLPHAIGVVALALGLLAWGLIVPAAQAQDLLMVSMDKAKLVRYPPNTETIIVGNPIIADVTMIKSSGILVVTGKGYGETNLLLLDRAGTVLSDARLRVEPSDALLVVQRGTDRESYACHPRCEPTVSIGDASTFLTTNSSAISSRNSLAMPSGAGMAGH